MSLSSPYTTIEIPISKAPFRTAIKWRMDAFIQQLPSIQHLAARRNAFFGFHQGIINQKPLFLRRAELLDSVSPHLDAEKTRERYLSFLDGHTIPANEVGSFLPPAIFLRDLNRRLAEIADVPARVS